MTGITYKMTQVKKLAIILLPLLVIGYFSKPDRGGAGRCTAIFELPELQQFHLSHRPFLAWEPFESPKFRFTISPSDFRRLAARLKAAGYSEWERGELVYGSLIVGGDSSDDHVFSTLARNGYSFTWSYSAKENLIYAIRFP